MKLFISILITMFSYCIYPYLKFSNGKINQYSKKEINKELIINSILVALIFIAIRIYYNEEIIITKEYPALFYYCLNRWLWIKHKDRLTIITNNLKLLKTIATTSIIINLIFLINTVYTSENNSYVIDSYEKTKLNYFNNNVVFINQNNDKYYYYECIIEKINDNDFYNYKIADINYASLNYEEGNCSDISDSIPLEEYIRQKNSR